MNKKNKNHEFGDFSDKINKYNTNITSFESMPFFRLGISAAYSGIIQSFVWSIISIAFICFYNHQDLNRKFHNVTLLTVFYDTFIRKYEHSLASKTIVVMNFHLLLSIIWMFGSIWLLVSTNLSILR